jgi:hypothetical protein
MSDLCEITPEIQVKLDKVLRTEITREEENDHLMAIIKRMPPEDAVELMLILAKRDPAICESEFFVKFATYFSNLSLNY